MEWGWWGGGGGGGGWGRPGVFEHHKFTNINLLIRFNKTSEVLYSVTRVLSILLTIAAITASIKGANSKEPVA